MSHAQPRCLASSRRLLRSKSNAHPGFHVPHAREMLVFGITAAGGCSDIQSRNCGSLSPWTLRVKRVAGRLVRRDTALAGPFYRADALINLNLTCVHYLPTEGRGLARFDSVRLQAELDFRHRVDPHMMLQSVKVSRWLTGAACSTVTAASSTTRKPSDRLSKVTLDTRLTYVP